MFFLLGVITLYDYSLLPNRIILCVDLRSFYASVSCIKKGLDPRYTKLAVVGDVNQSGSIVLAATPPLKALGIKKMARFYIAIFYRVKLKLITISKVILIFLKRRKVFEAKFDMQRMKKLPVAIIGGGSVGVAAAHLAK